MLNNTCSKTSVPVPEVLRRLLQHNDTVIGNESCSTNRGSYLPVIQMALLRQLSIKLNNKDTSNR